MSLVTPCPTHVICSKITDLDKRAFCAEVTTDFNEEEAAEGGGDGGGGDGGGTA